MKNRKQSCKKSEKANRTKQEKPEKDQEKKNLVASTSTRFYSTKSLDKLIKPT